MPALAVTALRLAAVETLAPWAAIQAGTGFPTIAEKRVYDSHSVGFDDLDEDGPPVPAIGVYTEETKGDRRGESAPSHPKWLTVDLVLEIEVAVLDRESDQPGADLLLSNPGNDAEAEIQLDFLAAQIRRLLELRPEGALFRKVAKSIERVTMAPFRLNELGVRLSRRTLTLTCAVDDDEWFDDGGLPEPLRTLAARLPADSYAAATLTRIAAALSPTVRDPLEALRVGINADGTAPASPETAAIQAAIPAQED